MMNAYDEYIYILNVIFYHVICKYIFIIITSIIKIYLNVFDLININIKYNNLK